jgi:nicotinamide phosphoribosyltransferase
MCSSHAIDKDEETLIKRLLTEIYPDGNFSMVCDSYDFWNVMNNILPKLKKKILARNGTLFVRHDSGDPVDNIIEMVKSLWKNFGGTTNSKGYKVIDPHIRAIYGDAITPIKAKMIYAGLDLLGFSPENVSLGAGSFSMLCRESEDGDYQPFTRDSFCVAVKTTYGEIEIGRRIDHGGNYGPPNGLLTFTQGFDIFKDPKTDKDNFKKSQRGCCIVYETLERETEPHTGRDVYEKVIKFTDGHMLEEAHKGYALLQNLLTPVFLNGKLVKTTSFEEIRNRLWDGKF